jgi:hypothetical protein
MPYNGLTAFVNVNMLDGHLLLTSHPVAFEGLHLICESPRQLVESTLSAVLLDRRRAKVIVAT